MKKLLIMLVVLGLSDPAAASFWYKCHITAKIENITISPNQTATPDVKVELVVLSAALKGGHIKDKSCGYKKGQKLVLNTEPTAEEIKQAEKFDRTITKKFYSKKYNINKLKPSDLITIRENFDNARSGDSHDWEVIRVNSILDKIFH